MLEQFRGPSQQLPRLQLPRLQQHRQPPGQEQHPGHQQPPGHLAPLPRLQGKASSDWTWQLRMEREGNDNRWKLYDCMNLCFRCNCCREGLIWRDVKKLNSRVKTKCGHCGQITCTKRSCSKLICRNCQLELNSSYVQRAEPDIDEME